MTDENDKKENLQEQLSSKTLQLETQQKEFMEWLEKMVKDLFQKEEYGTGAIYGYILSK